VTGQPGDWAKTMIFRAAPRTDDMALLVLRAL
jgi:hypothetical protein